MNDELSGEDMGEIPDSVLLQDGLYGLDKALESIMEMKEPEGQALAFFIHAAISYAEQLIDVKPEVFKNG
jgi:hypothetical protein